MSTPTDVVDLGSLLPFKSVVEEQRIEFVAPPDGLRFDRPFFHMTVEHLEEADKRDELDKVSLSFAQLRSLVGDRLPAPTGMIFHIGRCGSTLVSRMAGHDPGRLVLREPGPIGRLHRASAGNDLVPTFTLEQAFKDVLVAFDLFAAARGQQVLVKHSSWESFAMGRIAELVPTAPFVFVYRDSVQTVASSLDGHPGWAPRLHQPLGALVRWVPWLADLPQPFNAASIYASVWAAGADAALRLPSDRVLLIDHAELSADPDTQLDRLTQHLGLRLDPVKALAELGQYSKAKEDGTPYDPSGSHSHPALSPRTKAQIRQVVGDLPARLGDRLAEQRQSYHAA